MQGARPDEADGDERRAGTPHERGNEGEGGEADNNDSNHNNDSESKDDQERGEPGKRTKTTTGQRRDSSGPLRLLRTTQIAQEPLTPPKTNFLTQQIFTNFFQR